MKHGWTIVSLVLSIILASSFACSDDDDDNDDNSADDVTDDDLDTDDDNDTVDDDQTEEELPFCEPYQEPVFWFNPYVFDNQYYEYMQECAGSHFLTGTDGLRLLVFRPKGRIQTDRSVADRTSPPAVGERADGAP